MVDNPKLGPTLSQVDDAIEEWHRSEEDTSLLDWLGWSAAEYSDWVSDSSKIPNRPLKIR